jgi:natural product precursor
MEKKKISLRGLAKILSEKELKNVLGGSGGICSNSSCSGACGSYQKYHNGQWITVNMYCETGDFGYCGCM